VFSCVLASLKEQAARHINSGIKIKDRIRMVLSDKCEGRFAQQFERRYEISRLRVYFRKYTLSPCPDIKTHRQLTEANRPIYFIPPDE
jgi:hypothetical protein